MRKISNNLDMILRKWSFFAKIYWVSLRMCCILFVSVWGKPACLPLYLWVVFNLTALNLYSFSCRSSLFFSCRRKEAKGSAQSFEIRSKLLLISLHWQHRLIASRAVQTASALRTTICWRYCRFAEQIRPLLARRYYLNVSNQGMGELAFHAHPSSR